MMATGSSNQSVASDNDQPMNFADFGDDQDLSLEMEYFCVMCPDTFRDKKEAKKHYQQHLEYMPITCVLCGTKVVDVEAFVEHHTQTHHDEKRARYRKRENQTIEKWLNGFLYSQATIVRAFPPREQCPVCERIFSDEEIQANKPRRCTINRRIDHIHRHLGYLPYQCLKCKENDIEFQVAYFESKAHSHIKQKHPEVDDDENRWNIFQKTISIPKLDEFVANYVAQFGIRMEYERRPSKKIEKKGGSGENDDSMEDSSNSGDNSSQHPILTRPTPSTSNTLKRSPPRLTPAPKVGQLVSNLNNNRSPSQPPPLKRIRASDTPQFGHLPAGIKAASHLSTPFLRPNAEYKAVELEGEELFCLFCPQKFENKLDACPHYADHLDYKPIICLVCNSKFSDIDDLTSHHQNQHPEVANIEHEIREDIMVEKWVDLFLDSQPNAQENCLSCPCARCCPVCMTLQGGVPYGTPATESCSEHSEVVLSNHIHEHLVYHPFECLICSQGNTTFRVSNLDARAAAHLRDHEIQSSNVTQMRKVFGKTLIVEKLDKFISDFLTAKRMGDRHVKQGPPNITAPPNLMATPILQRAITQPRPILPKGSPPIRSPQQSSSNYNATQIVNKLIESIRSQKAAANGRPNGHPNGSSKALALNSKQFNSIQRKSGLGHVRIVGNRVIGLPPRGVPGPVYIDAPRPPPLKPKPKFASSNKLSINQLPSNGNVDRAHPEVIMKCLYCSVDVITKEELKAHHNQSHPLLPIACRAVQRSHKSQMKMAAY